MTGEVEPEPASRFGSARKRLSGQAALATATDGWSKPLHQRHHQPVGPGIRPSDWERWIGRRHPDMPISEVNHQGRASS